MLPDCLISLSLLYAQANPVAPRVNIVPHSRRAPEASEVGANLRVDATLAVIPVHVTTTLGTPVNGLGKENFRLFEDGVEQNISYFATEDAPLSLGLLFDSSGSMQNKMTKSLEAAAGLFKVSNAQDEFFLVEFNDRPKMSVPFTFDADQLYQRMVRTRPFGHTSLYDAVHLALGQMKKAANPRKALVILSDGGDNRSRHTLPEIRGLLLESDVQVYAMGIFDPEDVPNRPREELNGPRVLDELAEESGGRHYRVTNVNDLPEISTQIGLELRSQYVLGYSPSNGERNGKYRRVSVKLSPEGGPRLRMDYRRGYFAPNE
jgi:Ca-activated chloride channel family protein